MAMRAWSLLLKTYGGKGNSLGLELCEAGEGVHARDGEMTITLKFVILRGRALEDVQKCCFASETP